MRKRLSETRLVGARSAIRAGAFLVMLGLAVIGFAGYLLPAHSVDGGAWHSNFEDGGAWSLVVFGVFGVLAAHLRTRGFGAGMLTGVLAIATAIASLVPVILVHFMSHVDNGPGEVMMAISVLGLAFGGVALLIVEPVLYLTQRRANELDHASS
jgi:hypothetical protein